MSGSATRAQVGRIHASLAKLGITDRDEKLAALSAIVYQRIESSNQLSRDQASVCIDTLDSIADRPDPAGYLAGLTAAADRYFAGAAS
jgi:hypothetical protein